MDNDNTIWDASLRYAAPVPTLLEMSPSRHWYFRSCRAPFYTRRIPYKIYFHYWWWRHWRFPSPDIICRHGWLFVCSLPSLPLHWPRPSFILFHACQLLFNGYYEFFKAGIARCYKALLFLWMMLSFIDIFAIFLRISYYQGYLACSFTWCIKYWPRRTVNNASRHASQGALFQCLWYTNTGIFHDRCITFRACLSSLRKCFFVPELLSAVYFRFGRFIYSKF